MAKQGFVEIAVVTTVSGNVNCQCTFANASRTLSLGGFENVEVGRSSPVHSATHIPSPATYVKHFGSMDAAFQQLFNYYRKIRLDFRRTAAFLTMLRSFSGKSGMAMKGLSFEGIFSGTF